MQSRLTLLSLLCFLTCSLLQAQQNVGIGTPSPHSSAALEIMSTTKGILIPRAETSAITMPATGLLVFQPSDFSFYYYTGTTWRKFDGLVVDSDGDTRVSAGNHAGAQDSILFEIDNQKKLVLKRSPGGDLMMEPFGSSNTLHGNDAGQSLTSGSFNSGYGANALKSNQHGNHNTGIGYESLSGNTGGAMNTALGASTLSLNTFGNFNIATGVSAMQMNISGSNNVASGFNALKTNSTGNSNTAIGSSSLTANTIGNTNTGLGASSLAANTQGNTNTGVGASSLAANTTGSGNVAGGYNALKANTTANANVAFGREALSNTTTRDQLVAVGDSALHFNQLGWISNQDGIQNTAVGSKAMLKNTIGKWNSAFGYHAMRENINGVNNSAFGNNALHKHTAGSANTALGGDALWGHLTGEANTAIGNGAIGFNQTGSNNIGIGWRSGFNNLSGSNNIFIGTQAGHDELGSHKLYIENSNASAADALIYGDFNTNFLRFNAYAELNVKAPTQHGLVSKILVPPGSNYDAAALRGESKVDDFYGYGVYGQGGYVGVYGEVAALGSGSYFGVRASASGGTTGTKFALYGSGSGTGTNYGVFGSAGGGTTNYGVYGTAFSGTNNYAGYFLGRGYFSDPVGIGNENPSELLHVSGTDDPTIMLQSDGVDEVSGKVAMRQSNFTGMDMYYDGAAAGEALVFESFTNGTSNGRKMTMDLNGNVGIGITENIALDHKLSINGKIACTEVRVQPQNQWPDYVFANDYKLMPLQELKSSIAQNNHLPGIPSANEIEAGGLQLGDMQVRMMEKIEELTLYILQLHEEIELLKKENKVQVSTSISNQ